MNAIYNKYYKFFLKHSVSTPYISLEKKRAESINTFKHNYGMTTLTIQKVKEQLHKLDEHIKITGSGALPIVSIGSGLGAFEYMTPEFNWVLVDPDPIGYETNGKHDPNVFTFKDPDYKNVNNLLKSQRDIRGNCVVFINWSIPGQEHYYDYDAIIKLQPRIVIAIYENINNFYFNQDDTLGKIQEIFNSNLIDSISGSDHFIKWVYHQDVVPLEHTDYVRLNSFSIEKPYISIFGEERKIIFDIFVRNDNITLFEEN